MNSDNRRIKLANQIPWNEFEVKYAKLFPSDTRNITKPLHIALGTLFTQTRFLFSGRLVQARWFSSLNTFQQK